MEKSIQLDEIVSMSTEQLEDNATLLHPAGLYLLAKKLYQQGDKDKSILWFYIGSLRYRYYLTSIDDDPFHPEQELFGKVQFEIGTVLLDYAGGNPEHWAQQIENAIEWDKENVNVFFDKQNDPVALLEIGQAMIELQNQLIEQKQDIIRQRIENNAEVRV